MDRRELCAGNIDGRGDCGVGSGFDRGCYDVVVVDRGLLVNNSFIPPQPLLPLQIEQNDHRTQHQDETPVLVPRNTAG